MPRKRAPKWLLSARLKPEARRAATERSDWIGRALARVGALPPSELEAALRAGRVRVNGRTVSAALTPYRAGDEVRVDGRPVPMEAATHVWMFHKPAGCVTAPTDDLGHPTAFERFFAAVPPAWHRYGWHAVGRLDRGTTGLLLFTNHERIVEHLTAPATHLPKRYLATVQGQPTLERLEPLTRGIVLHDGPTRPAEVRLRGPHQVELTLTEGRHHQVKHMLAAVGFPVRALHREAVGELALDVEVGAARVVSDAELIDKLRCTWLAPPAS
jgi:23S rRNA pseudouridine2605 synthase/16S rRNA pseudouridine516 synthase